MLQYSALALAVGFVLDLLIGDPRWLYHPVRIIGNAIAFLERILRKIFPAGQRGERAAGFVLVVCILLFSGAIPLVILWIGFRVHTALGVALECFLCYQMLAVRSLKDESMRVHDALRDGTLEDGRKAVSMIVGRDTQALDEKGVIKAAVETVAENFSDGVIAPMFYMIIGGPVLMYIYKGINTMDSMVGYKNERYLNFGRYGAKLDDVAGYIPARLAALFLIGASSLMGFDAVHGWRIFKRDRYNHASPNSAQTESAMAGILGVELAGPAYYFGTLHEKPTIGDDLRPIELEDIRRANRLTYMGSGLAVILFCLLQIIVVLLA